MAKKHGCTTPLSSQDAYCIDITYWVDVDKAKVTQDQIKKEKKEAAECNISSYENVYLASPWFLNDDFIDLIQFVKTQIGSFDVCLHAKAGEGFCMYCPYGSTCHEVVIVTVTKDRCNTGIPGLVDKMSERWGDKFVVRCGPLGSLQS